MSDETTLDTARLSTLEASIERGLTTFVEVGLALLEIRDGKMYRGTHSAFDDYCRERWHMDRTRAHKLIEAAQTVENIQHFSEPPAVESHAAELAKIKDPAEQRKAWTEVVESAPKDKAGKPKVTAKAVQQVVAKRKTPAPPAPKKEPEPAAPSAPATPVEPWDDYNAEVAALVVRLESLGDDIVKFANVAGITKSFRDWVDPKQYRGVFNDYVAIFNGHKVTGFASAAQAKILPGQRNFLYAKDGKKKKGAA